VIGGGFRKPDDMLELFERVINLIRRHAPGAAMHSTATPRTVSMRRCGGCHDPSRSPNPASPTTHTRKEQRL